MTVAILQIRPVINPGRTFSRLPLSSSAFRVITVISSTLSWCRVCHRYSWSPSPPPFSSLVIHSKAIFTSHTNNSSLPPLLLSFFLSHPRPLPFITTTFHSPFPLPSFSFSTSSPSTTFTTYSFLFSFPPIPPPPPPQPSRIPPPHLPLPLHEFFHPPSTYAFTNSSTPPHLHLHELLYQHLHLHLHGLPHLPLPIPRSTSFCRSENASPNRRVSLSSSSPVTHLVIFSLEH